ncbi:MAG: DUF4388 domain-containing protein [Desulfococcaceae bacterium]|nr:DUF4388 domain-containing protein [Desulfococcaceae bacterium]
MKKIKTNPSLSVLVLSSTPDLCGTLSVFPENECRPVSADNILKALDMLSRMPFDVLLADMEELRKDMVKLLIRAKKQDPAIHPVLLTDAEEKLPSPEIAERSVITYISKKCDAKQFRALIRKRTQTLQWQKRMLNILDVVILYSVCAENLLLRINSAKNAGEENGEIFFEKGTISSARCGNRLGEDAFYEIMKWENGRFSEQRMVKARQRDIFRKRDDLLTEVIRYHDSEIRLMKTVEFNISDMAEETEIAAADSADSDELADFAYRLSILQILKELREKSGLLENALVTDMQGNILSSLNSETSEDMSIFIRDSLIFRHSRWPEEEGMEEMIVFCKQGITMLFPVSDKGILGVRSLHHNFGMIRSNCEPFVKRLATILR